MPLPGWCNVLQINTCSAIGLVSSYQLVIDKRCPLIGYGGQQPVMTACASAPWRLLPVQLIADVFFQPAKAVDAAMLTGALDNYNNKQWSVKSVEN